MVVSNTALDMRFRHTLLPFYLILSFFGIQYYNKKTILPSFIISNIHNYSHNYIL